MSSYVDALREAAKAVGAAASAARTKKLAPRRLTEAVSVCDLVMFQVGELAERWQKAAHANREALSKAHGMSLSYDRIGVEPDRGLLTAREVHRALHSLDTSLGDVRRRLTGLRHALDHLTGQAHELDYSARNTHDLTF